MKGNEALRAAIPRLRDAGIEDAARDARLLLAHAMGLAPDRLTLHLPDPLTEGQHAAYEAAIAARAARQPVSQIIGQRLFWGRSFRVTRDTLDPRPETELLVAEALSRPFVKMADLGTGTGCILISCLLDMPMATGLGTDQSLAALEVAEGNARAHGLGNRARFRQADWFSGIADRFDLIVSNPPYIAADEMPALSPEVRNWEPLAALSPGGDGLAAYRTIALGAGARLMPGGRLLLEIGPTQGAAVLALLAAQGFQGLRILPDLDGRDRVVVAAAPGDAGHCGSA
ncbi:peptide chain release factor N(5)-glutamine methyltransferase [Fuscibacter oryzae]|uniref:Release factor glutamine methyltransferase n=1 Tax=Fuscibacter oryzae TaxID=2803939 RepID=A0A8J7MTC9_9RHOB|nr:peptide chain release factor N(5)-glutamine methyltransferase [Fuscibacter oryzae]MBL4928043.1 peptide chain release factor N(5)-glutamine methyltransferase [Fuscibacter oryzae]